MRALAAGILVSSVCSAPLLAQERDRSIERISLTLQQPPPSVRGVEPLESDLPKKLGIFILVSPRLRGEVVRVSVPVGELMTNAFTHGAAANQRRREVAARRRVEAALKRFLEQHHPEQ